MVEDPYESGACRPAREWLFVQAGSRLVWRVPRAARIGQWQAANVACDLLALQRGQAMEACAGDDAGVGEVEVFQVAPILRVTVGAARLNPRTIWKVVRCQLSGVPQLSPRLNRSRIWQWRRPAFGCILHKTVWREDFLSLGGQKIPCQDAIAADDSVSPVESKADCVFAPQDHAAGEGKGHHERGKASADSAESLAGLGD